MLHFPFLMPRWALNVAKREGGGCTYEFDAEIGRQVNEAKVLEAELREALHRETLRAEGRRIRPGSVTSGTGVA